MESIKNFYKNKKILVTGATGFKGAWLCSWLLKLKAKVYSTGYNPNQNRAGGAKLTKVTPPKLNMFDKITKFSNQILNSGIAKGIFSLSNLIYNPKAFLLYSVVRPTPLADGTLEGKPGVYDPEQFIFDEDMAVNIFTPSEERESMIPFDADIEAPLVTTSTDLQAPNNNVFIDYEFNTSEDLFFIKMAGS